MIVKKGIAVSDGIAIGKCYKLDRNNVFIVGYNIGDIDRELQKLKSAVNHTLELFEEKSKINNNGKVNTQELYDAYRMLLTDRFFVGGAEELIRKDKINAEYALKKIRDTFIATVLASDNDYLRDRIHDLEHIYQRVQRYMSDQLFEEFYEAENNSLIISHDLNPFDIDLMIKKGLKGFATDVGGKTSHNSILARSAGIVAVVGLDDIYDSVSHGEKLIIDGFLGQIIINPTSEVLRKYKKRKTDHDKLTKPYSNIELAECRTVDGEKVELYGNIEINKDIEMVNNYRLGGVGLYRTEFLYLNNHNIDEESQYKIYKEAVEGISGKPLILRSFDLGGDKSSRSKVNFEEENPVMGLRAVRYSLMNEDLFRKQLRAILRVAYGRDVRLLIPMVSSIDELLKVKDIIIDESSRLKDDNIKHNPSMKLGIMVELPSTALSLDKYVDHIDFLSIGTNDLIQYILGIDRNNSSVANLYSPAHSAVISVLSKIYNDASKSNKDITICGELAGDSNYISMLIGLGYRSFSMNPKSSYMVRKVINNLDSKDCKKLVESMKNAKTVKESESILYNFNKENIKNIFV